MALDFVRNGFPEQNLIDWCQQFCRPDQIFLDIGAHMGTYALSLAPHCKAVHAFECQRETYYQLCGGVALNAQWNVHAHQVALGRTNAPSVPLYIISLDGGGSSLLQPLSEPLLEQQYVECRTLDSFHLTNVGFMKLDVEGMEEDVLRGSLQTLQRSDYPPILLEAWTDDRYAAQKKSLLAFLSDELHYQIHAVNGYPFMLLAVKPRSTTSSPQ